MERQQTDNLLKSHASGTYLIRERPAEAERFAISIKYVKGTPPQCGSEPRSPLPSRSWACRAGGGCGMYRSNQTLEMKGHLHWVYTT